MNKRTNKWLLIPTLLMLWGMVYVGRSNVFAAQPEGVLKQAIHWKISADWLDPSIAAASTLSWVALQFFHDALVKPMPEGTYTPSLAESYSVSADSKVYEFKLRKGVKFHNGDTMTAEDVVFSFWRYKGRGAKMIHGATERLEVVNPYVVRIHFKNPFPDFLDYLLPGGGNIGWIVPKRYVEKVGEAGFKQRPVGAGPYKFVDFVPGVKMAGEAFEGYWRKVPNVKRIEFYSVPDRTTRVAMVRRGEADIATQITDVLYEEVKKDPNLRVLVPLSPMRPLISMAAQWDPKSPWSDARVRRAASLAIDRQTLADIHMPGTKPVGSIALEGDPFALALPPDPYDPDRARRLLAEAGYPKGFHGGKFYGVATYWPYSEQIATYWRAVGISVEMVRVDPATFFAFRDGGKLKGDVFVDTVVAPTIGARLAHLFGPASYGNYPEIATLWSQYQREFRLDVRKDLIARIQKLIYEKTMYIPLNEVNTPAAIGPRVKGNPYKIQPLVWVTAPLEDVELAK